MSDLQIIRKELGSEAPESASIRQDQEGRIAGARLYVVEREGHPNQAVAVVDGEDGPRVLRGLDAFRTLRAQVGNSDARAVARLSVLFLEPAQAGAKVIPAVGSAPELEPEHEELVAAPTVDGAELVYWRWPVPSYSEGMRTAPEPWRCVLDLTTYEVACVPARKVSAG